MEVNSGGIWAYLGLLDSFVYKQRNQRFDRDMGYAFLFFSFLLFLGFMVFLILKLAKEHPNCKFIAMATVSVLSDTVIEDSWNAKGNNKICKFASLLLSFFPTEDLGALSFLLNVSIDFIFSFSTLLGLLLFVLLRLRGYGIGMNSRFLYVYSYALTYWHALRFPSCSSRVLVVETWFPHSPNDFAEIVGSQKVKIIVESAFNSGLAGSSLLVPGSIPSQVSSQNIIVYGLFGSNAYKLKDNCMFSTYLQHRNLKSTVKLLLPQQPADDTEQLNVSLGVKADSELDLFLRMRGETFLVFVLNISAGVAKVGMELNAKILYYLLQESVAFGAWNMIGLDRTFMIIEYSHLSIASSNLE
ncbi:hypothetical protein DKX38_016962 [Salix brachista]|uniref:Uncharacterized protein n=1 Tax=Salix brachista TaxID=2182728 RepID=A0A5N5KV54_9ROSI|nr:hypothetical protein DKX38_016962 [Salix brachista]